MDKTINILLMFYRTASRRIIQTINSSDDFSREANQARLKQIDVILQDLDKKTKKWVDRETESAYKSGHNNAETLLESVGINLTSSFGKIDKEAVKVMANDSYLAFAESISGVKRHTTQIINMSTKQRIQAILADGKISGASKKEIANNIAGELKQGFIVLKDKAGKTWQIDNYAEMLARTKMTEATNKGLTNRMQEENYDLVQVTDHGTKCELCQPHEGEIYSISGKSKEYPALDTATGLFHPRCEHRLVPYHEDFAKQSKAWSTDLQKYV